MQAVFHDEDQARAVVSKLRSAGYPATAARGRFAGEDDDEDQPWLVVADEAPDFLLELLVDEYDGWLERPEPATRPALDQPLELPRAPKRHHRPPT